MGTTLLYTLVPKTSRPSNPAAPPQCDVHYVWREDHPAYGGQVAFHIYTVFTVAAPEEAPPHFPHFHIIRLRKTTTSLNPTSTTTTRNEKNDCSTPLPYAT